jgi:hypothetical protein
MMEVEDNLPKLYYLPLDGIKEVATMRTRLDTRVWLLFFCGIGFALMRTANAQEKIVPTFGQDFEAVVSITTSPDGMNTYITVPSSEKGKPLAAGFVIQYKSRTDSPLNFTGPARIVYNEEQPALQPLALRVKTSHGKCWMFETDVYGGRVPGGCQVVEGMAGLAHYWWSKPAKDAPRTHKEFVRYLEE